jgi:hypothetical protein
MTIPAWDDPDLKAGTMIRTALWLMTEVGIGNTFTKEEHRAAFAGVTQADRRLRDLRTYGWVIHTSLQDASLNSDEQRFVCMGEAVWESGARKRPSKGELVSARRRKAVLAESNYQCSVCGIAAGERYSDAPTVTAVLAVSRRRVVSLDGVEHLTLVSECNVCRAGDIKAPVNVDELIGRCAHLGEEERAVLRMWLRGASRESLSSLWRDIQRLPDVMRAQLIERLV